MKVVISVINCVTIPFDYGHPGIGLGHNSFPSYKIGHTTKWRRVDSKTRALRISFAHSCLEVRRVNYRPPGTQQNLLDEVSFSLPEKSFGLIFGRSGSGKTTLLHLLAGLSKPTSGSITIQRYGNDGNPSQSSEPLAPESVGMVFQFPERYFLADTILEEMTFGWPRQKADFALRERLALKLQYAINSVGLNNISLDEDPHSLSGGYKRRLALAIQLVQTPQLLLLDEPLAGLDWKARADVVKLLKHLKKELTILVVSHDLRELSSLVDRSWRMQMGGILKEEALPL
ncbi:ABC transporter I family member 11, chloroplastic-like isoform X1 [Zingiber officinale]|uniref:ABC transporter I family member 11, chloroplastic-like isoform X1 n=1 Tax=Zingiber officinale TaxID=94328 RepID=UPI001C4B65D5|nr:ABC transporter I family member 11, chloroplastic-like isoform X1 [Zingiber officinale]XP_042385389.1 ABC transporter I family member 11, chloroplastic-like isoform X1 [Zingiber officinale]XP_042385390.1 ABC transporter I family member 11, chloroplastic-like isoform X1 [Zingiber officinale]